MSAGCPSRPAVGPEVRMMPTPTVSPTTTAIPKASPTTRSRPRPREAIAATLDIHYPLRPFSRVLWYLLHGHELWRDISLPHWQCACRDCRPVSDAVLMLTRRTFANAGDQGMRYALFWYPMH